MELVQEPRVDRGHRVSLLDADTVTEGGHEEIEPLGPRDFDGDE